jgi:hypothetical protein
MAIYGPKLSKLIAKECLKDIPEALANVVSWWIHCKGSLDQDVHVFILQTMEDE